MFKQLLMNKKAQTSPLIVFLLLLSNPIVLGMLALLFLIIFFSVGFNLLLISGASLVFLGVVLLLRGKMTKVSLMFLVLGLVIILINQFI
jgi:hypothetical protein